MVALYGAAIFFGGALGSKMDSKDFWTLIVAAYAAVVATGAFSLEIRRWFESGPRLKLRLMPNAIVLEGGDLRERTYIAATVTNVGTLPTTVTGMGYLQYDNVWRRLRRKSTFQAIIPNPSLDRASNVPHVLLPGTQWTGLGAYTPDLAARVGEGHFYVQIITSHRAKPLMHPVRLHSKELNKLKFGRLY